MRTQIFVALELPESFQNLVIQTRIRFHASKIVPLTVGILAPCLCNIYITDFPKTPITRYKYADDVALTAWVHIFMEAEFILARDISVINNYLTNWWWKLSIEKTVHSDFHLKNHLANCRLSVKIHPNVDLTFDSNPSYRVVQKDLFHYHYHFISNPSKLTQASDFQVNRSMRFKVAFLNKQKIILCMRVSRLQRPISRRNQLSTLYEWLSKQKRSIQDHNKASPGQNYGNRKCTGYKIKGRGGRPRSVRTKLHIVTVRQCLEQSPRKHTRHLSRREVLIRQGLF